MITLSNEEYEAHFDEENGLNLVSFKKNGLEIIDQSASSKKGPIIGPHFHVHTKHSPPDGKEYHHGLGRYAAWRTVHSETQIRAHISGQDKLNSYTLKELEGQDFEMRFDIRLIPSGLRLKLEVVSDKPSMCGFHYYYKLGPNPIVHAPVKDQYNDQGIIKPLPPEWKKDKQLYYDLTLETDFGFIPSESPFEHKIIYQNDNYELNVHYLPAHPEEVQFQLYSPKGASFVCIEPMSAKEPRKPKLKHSLLEMKLEIV